VLILLTSHLIEVLQCPETDEECFKNLKRISVGGDKMPDDLPEKFKKFSNVKLTNAYGSTEFFCSIIPVGTYDDMSCVGVRSGFGEVRIVDDQGKAITEPGQVGELQQRGGFLFKGYYNQEEITKSSFTEDGFYCTGDLVSTDGKLFYFRGRIKQIIIRRGSNILPQEVEDVFYLHPKVLLAGVIGSPHPVDGSVPKVYLQLQNMADEGEALDATLKEIYLLAKKNLADYKIPIEIVVLKYLPTTVTGKVFRKELEILNNKGDQTSESFIKKVEVSVFNQ
jgi:long-chain acyl-CoA synthetase